MLNLKYKLYKNNKIQRLNSLNLTACIIWNHITALQKRYYSLYGKYISTNRVQKHIAKLRKKNNYWSKLNSQSVQEICQRHDQAYQRFFKKLAKRPPKFKKVKDFKSFVYKQSGWKIIDNRLIINNIGTYRFKKTRNYENIKRISIKRDSVGDYYLILTCDMEPKKYKRVGDSTIGLDFGLKTYLTTSKGDEILSPLFLSEELDKIKIKSKTLSKKKKGSNNRKKSVKNLSRLHKKISNKRNDFEWKLAHELCKHSAFISIEDLNIEGMKKLWGRKISDLSFSSFVSKLEQVALKYNTIVQKVDRYYPSSKICNSCGFKKQDLTLKDREYICNNCGVVEPRDLNAAKNILTEGIRLYRTKHKTNIELAV